MQSELDALLPGLIQILGVNEIGHESGNTSICTGRDIPWLQETALDPVWTDWAVTYRDVIVLDEANISYGVHNVSTLPISDPTNYDDLKQMFIDAATD